MSLTVDGGNGGAVSVASGNGSSPPEKEAFGRPRQPKPRRHGVWRARLILLALVAGAVALGLSQVDRQLDGRERLQLTSVTLTADPVEVYTARTGLVTQLGVGVHEPVRAGQRIAVIQATEFDRNGDARQVDVPIDAPVSGLAFEVGTYVGSVVRSGDSVARLYQPERVYFRAQIQLDELDDVSIGMRARLQATAVDAIDARVVRVQPQVGVPEPTVPKAPGSETAELILVPEDAETVRNLLPGLTFQGWLERGSAPPGSPSGVYAGAT